MARCRRYGNITISESVDRGFVKKEDVSLVGTGAGKDIDVDRLLNLKPDLVILTNEYPSQVELAETLRDNQIKTLLFQVDSFLDYLSMLKSCTTILNTQESYQTYGTEILNTVERVLEETSEVKDHPKVLFLRASLQEIKITSTDHFVGNMIHELKAINIASGFSIQTENLSPEIILTSNADQVYISILGDKVEETIQVVEQEFIKNPAYQSLKAIKEKKYYFLPKEWFSYKPNRNWGKAYEYLANLLYPKE